MIKKILTMSILVMMLSFLAVPVQAAYIPKEYKNEAAMVVKNDITLYKFAIKYSNEHWAYDILRQLAQNYTNNGKISDLHKIMKVKFKVVI